MNKEQLIRIIDNPVPWGLAGFFFGLGLGASSAGAWPIAIGLLAYIYYVKAHAPAGYDAETPLFSTGPLLMITWVFGFVVRSWAF